MRCLGVRPAARNARARASDPLPPGTRPTLEQWADAVRPVMDEVGSRRAAVLGAVEGGLRALMFAAMHPERTSALVLAEASPYFGKAPGYPGGFGPPEVRQQIYAEMRGSGLGSADEANS